MIVHVTPTDNTDAIMYEADSWEYDNGVIWIYSNGATIALHKEWARVEIEPT